VTLERIFLGLGANLPSQHGSPRETLEAALAAIAAAGITLKGRSRWYESAPVPRADDQPWYVNGVVEVTTDLEPAGLLTVLQGIERDFGRVRSVPNAPRSLDLDIVAYGDRVVDEVAPLLPHPRMDGRAFVLLPLRDLAPDWRHPRTGLGVEALIAGLGRLDDPLGQEIRPLA
jgi:2-amino-4-hydroxy-6-hydroxymethyldihydropteridine diphosphokinase